MDKKNWELSNEEILETRKFDLYNNYVYSQKKGFEALINFINNLTNKMKEDGKISDLFEIRARIKAPQSAIHNDDHKVLNDVFGMEIITATEEELYMVANAILKHMDIVSEKKHDKANGYKALHRLLDLKKDEIENLDLDRKCIQIPLVEIQFKTMEVAVKSCGGTADHAIYKGETKEEVQRKYDNGEFSIFTNVPTMWVSRNGEIKMLSTEETLKKMYPFLKLKEKNNEKGDRK